MAFVRINRGGSFSPPLAGSRRAKLALRGRGWGSTRGLPMWHPPPQPSPARDRKGGGSATFAAATSRRFPSRATILMSTKPPSRRHQLDAPVQRAAGLGGVGADGSEKAEARGAQSRLRDAVAFH